MPRIVYFLSSMLLGTAAFLTVACGSASQRVLESVAISPNSADAQDFPNGQVQFTATGTYNNAPVKVSPLQDATWGVALAQASTNQVLITSNGLAQCAAGAAGIFTVGAWDVMHSNGATCTVVGPYGEPACNAALGTAQLTCP